MARKKRKKAVAPRLTRKQVSRAKREARQRKLLLIGSGVVAAILILVLAWGVYHDKVAVPNQPVVLVNGEPITTAEFQKQVVYRRMNLIEQARALPQLADQVRQQLDSPLVLGQQVLTDLIEERIIRQEAARRGITVTPDEVQKRIEELIGYPYPPTPEPLPTLPPPTVPPTVTVTPRPTLTPTLTPTPMSRAAFEAAYQSAVERARRAGLTEADLRRSVETGLYRERLMEAMGPELVPEVQDQIQITYIVVSTTQDAQAMLDRLAAGEVTFDDLAAEVQDDDRPDTASREVDWQTQDFLGQVFGEETAALLFDLEVGDYTHDPVLGPDGRVYLIRVDGHEERPLPALALEQLRRQAFQEWLDEQVNNPEIVQYILEGGVPRWQARVPQEPTL